MKSVQYSTPRPPSATLRIVETFTTTVILMVLTFATSVATARILGPEGRGYTNMLATWLPVLGTVASCGMGRTFVYYSKIDPQHFGRYRRRLFLVVGTASVPIALIGGVSAALLYPNLPATELRAFQWLTGLSLPVYAIGFALTQAAQYRSDMRVYNISRVVQPLLLFAGLTAAVFLHSESYRMFAAIATAAIGLSALIVGTALFQYVNLAGESVSLPLPSRGAYGKYAASSYVTDVMGVLGANLDKIFIVFFLSAKEMGIYAVAFALSRIVGQIQGAVGETIFSMSIGLSTAEVGYRIAKIFRESLLISLSCGIAAVAIVPPLIPFIFGKAFTSVGSLFVILVAEAAITGASGVLGQIFNIIGRPHLVLMRLVLSTIVGAMLMFSVVRTFGTIGIAVAAVFSASIRLFASILIYRSATQLPARDFVPTITDARLMFSAIQRKFSGASE